MTPEGLSWIQAPVGWLLHVGTIRSVPGGALKSKRPKRLQRFLLSPVSGQDVGSQTPRQETYFLLRQEPFWCCCGLVVHIRPSWAVWSPADVKGLFLSQCEHPSCCLWWPWYITDISSAWCPFIAVHYGSVLQCELSGVSRKLQCKKQSAAPFIPSKD